MKQRKGDAVQSRRGVNLCCFRLLRHLGGCLGVGSPGEHAKKCATHAIEHFSFSVYLTFTDAFDRQGVQNRKTSHDDRPLNSMGR